MKLSLNVALLIIIGEIFISTIANAIENHEQFNELNKALALGQKIKKDCASLPGRYMGSQDDFEHPEESVTFFLLQCDSETYMVGGSENGTIKAVECPDIGDTKESSKLYNSCMEKLF